MPACPKPEPHKRVKARAKREAAAQRRACTDQVWQRAGDGASGECECTDCGKHEARCYAPVWRSHVNFRKVGHVDEVIPKSLGGDPTDPTNCRLLCHGCHFSGPSGAHRTTRRPA